MSMNELAFSSLICDCEFGSVNLKKKILQKKIYSNNIKCAACANCAEEHDTRDCKNVTERCVNCVLANKSLGLNLNVDHCAWSRECRVYKRKENDKKRKINYNME
jgi:hypothetical protein